MSARYNTFAVPTGRANANRNVPTISKKSREDARLRSAEATARFAATLSRDYGIFQNDDTSDDTSWRVIVLATGAVVASFACVTDAVAFIS